MPYGLVEQVTHYISNSNILRTQDNFGQHYLIENKNGGKEHIPFTMGL